MRRTVELDDPCSEVRDANTSEPISGAMVTLYDAATDEPVYLPAVLEFAPFDNASPVQTTDHSGRFAWLVYPDTEYYIVVTAPGYETYVSPILHDDRGILKHYVLMTPVTVSAHATPCSPVAAEEFTNSENDAAFRTQDLSEPECLLKFVARFSNCSGFRFRDSLSLRSAVKCTSDRAAIHKEIMARLLMS